jgi:hypothetical protein
MGTYVFRRIEDMFEFFRTDQDYYNKSGRADKLAINLGYWSEKLQAPKPDAATEYSAEKFAEHVIEAFNAWVEENKPDPENSTADQRSEFDMAKGELWSELENDVLRFANDGEIRSYDAANKFSSAIAPGFNMDDCGSGTTRNTHSISSGAATPSHGASRNSTAPSPQKQKAPQHEPQRHHHHHRTSRKTLVHPHPRPG